MRLRPAAAPVIAAFALAAAGCDSKTGSFFRPGGESQPDATPPVFAGADPGPVVDVFGGDRLTIQVTDPPDGGIPGSGVDPGSIQASVAGGDPLIAIVNLPTVTIELGGVPDGPVQVVVVARDRAGNQATHIFDFTMDRTGPPLQFTQTPPATTSVSLASFVATIGVQVGTEPHFQSGTVEARTPGPDGICGTADDGAVPAEVLENPARPLLGPGHHSVTFILSNPVPPGGTATGATYCWVATATDEAVGEGGEPGGNRTTIAARTAVFWLAP